MTAFQPRRCPLSDSALAARLPSATTDRRAVRLLTAVIARRAAGYPRVMSLALPYRVVLFAGLLLAVWTLFWQLSVLLLAVLLTVIVALPLTAVTDWLQRHHVPRPVGAIGTILLALAAVAAFGYLIAPTLATQAERAVAEIPTVVQRVREQLGLAANAETARAGFEIQAFVQSYLDDPTRLAGRVRNVLTTGWPSSGASCSSSSPRSTPRSTRGRSSAG